MTTAKSSDLSVTTPSDTEIVVTRAFEAPRDLVWQAYTEPAHLRQWMGGFEGWVMTVCEMELRPGGTYHFAWRQEDGTEMVISGEVREVDAPARLVSTESWGGDWAEAINTIDFVEENGVTTLTTTVAYPSKEARDAALATGMTDGMSTSYDRLEALLRLLAAAG